MHGIVLYVSLSFLGVSAEINMDATAMRRIVCRLTMFASYWLGLVGLFYWLNRRAKRIVCFHSVLPDGLKMRGLACGLDNTEDEFRMIVREVKRRFGISTDVFDPGTVTLSFDDGFANQYEVAARVLAEEGDVPALLFVAGDMVGCRSAEEAIVVEQLLSWVAYAPLECLAQLRDWPGGGDVDLSSRMSVWGGIVRPAFALDVASMGRDTLLRLDAIYPLKKVYSSLPSEYLRLRMTGVSREQIEELQRKGWVVGWHTKSHFPLKSLPVERQEMELRPPEYVTNVVMAYPYGDRQSVGEETMEIVRGMDYGCALSFDVGNGKVPDRCFLPRMFLSSNKYALHFELSGLKFFFRHLRLLPVWTDGSN